MIRKLLWVVLLMIGVSTASASNIGVQAGYGLSYKGYNAQNGEDRGAGNRIDELFSEIQWNRDFQGGKTGGLMSDIDLSALHLNYFPETSGEFTAPYASSGSGESGTDLFYDYDIRFRFIIPKRTLRLSLNTRGEKTLVPENRTFFVGSGGVHTNIPELEGVETTLDRYIGSSDTDYSLHYYGKKFQYILGSQSGKDKRTDEGVDFRTDHGRTYGGFAWDKKYGVYVAESSETYDQHSDDFDRKSITLGIINEYGTDQTVYNKNNVYSWYGSAKLGTVAFADGEEHPENKIRAGFQSELKDQTFLVRGTHQDSASHVANEETSETDGHVEYEYRTPEMDYYAKADYSEQSRSTASITGSVVNGEGAVNTTLNEGFIGNGVLTFTTTGNAITLEFTGLLVDGEDISSIRIISPGTEYTVAFTESVAGSVNVLVGDVADIQMAIDQSLDIDYSRRNTRVSVGYYLKQSKSFRSRFDVEIDENDIVDFSIVGGSYELENTKRMNITKLFEIRPLRYIFDVEIKYSDVEQGDLGFTESSLMLKDGMYSTQKKFYAQFDVSSVQGNGFDDKERTAFQLVAEDNNNGSHLKIVPAYSSTTLGSKYTLSEVTLDADYHAPAHRLDIHWKDETERGITETYEVKRENQVLFYEHTRDWIRGKVKYRMNKTDITYTEMQGALELIKTKRFPAGSPFITNEIGYVSSKTEAAGAETVKNTYIYDTISYTPTQRLLVQLSYEQQVDETNKGRDIEFAVKYRTRSFKLGLGYRTMSTTHEGEKKNEDIIYFEIRKGFSAGSFI